MTPSVAPGPPSGEQFELAHADQVITVVEVGGALRSYSARGHELLEGYAADEICSGARGHSLIPWPNRLRDGRYEFGGQHHQVPLTEPEQGNAIHGLVRWANWTLAERDSDRIVMEHCLHPGPGYPYELLLRIAYTLGPAGLTVASTATNAGAEACPYGAGAHPYLTVGTDTIDACTLRAPGSVRMLSDERQIPLGTERVNGSDYDFRSRRVIGPVRLDTAYCDLERSEDGRARVTLTAPDGGTGVTLWLDETYPYLMLFTGDSLPEPERRRRGLGVEPMTCAPNAFQTGDGLRTLKSGESFTSTWGIEPLRAQKR